MTKTIKNKYTKNFFSERFPTPFEMLLFYDEDLRDGRRTLYPWQSKILKSFGRDLIDWEAINIALRANNGSGKSQYILAPCIVWVPLVFDRALSYVTSSSANQLDTQTERYCDYLIGRINSTHKEDFGGAEIFHAVKRKKHFYLTDSFIDLIATDEGTKAEGKHPLQGGIELALFVDEGKSVLPEIYDALDRCTGYTRRLDASSPGERMGHFFDINTRPELGWEVHKVTAYDCPHISKKSIDKRILQHGINDPLIRSSVFAEFTSEDSQVVIRDEVLETCEKNFKGVDLVRFGRDKRAGLDLSAGGDEMVLSIWQANEMIDQEVGRFKDTTNGVKQVLHWIRQHSISPSLVKADDGGLGKGMIDLLHLNECYVTRALNNARAFDSTRYLNRGSETWFNLARFVETCLVKFIPDKLLKIQLTTRFYEIREGKIKLESKEKARANDRKSPDRADAVVLAWSDLLFSEIIEADFIKTPTESRIGKLKLEDVEAYSEEQDFRSFNLELQIQKEEREQAFSLLKMLEEQHKPRGVGAENPLAKYGFNGKVG